VATSLVCRSFGFEQLSIDPEAVTGHYTLWARRGREHAHVGIPFIDLTNTYRRDEIVLAALEMLAMSLKTDSAATIDRDAARRSVRDLLIPRTR
jgi:hypothetical protein